jgi:hypothetical protein
MLNLLLPFADEPGTEEALQGILPASPPKPPRPRAPLAAPARPKAPDRITDRVQVTRDLVFAATQTFDAEFTVNDVVRLMTNAATIDPPERLRIRSSIAQCMTMLCDRGEVLKDSQGIGRQQTLWRRVRVNGRASASARAK